LEIEDLKLLEKQLLDLGPALEMTLCDSVFDLLLPILDRSLIIGYHIGVGQWIKEKEAAEKRSIKRDARRAEAGTSAASLEENEVQCCLCFLPAEDPVKITVRNCKHVFCEHCIEEDVESQKDDFVEGETSEVPLKMRSTYPHLLNYA
jgi:hypothetical protein